MKTNTDIRIPILLPLGNGNYHINYNEQEVEIDGRKSYNYDTILVDSNDRATIIQAIIAEKYTVADELKILYRGTDEEKKAHEEWVAFAKSLYEKIRNYVGY